MPLRSNPSCGMEIDPLSPSSQDIPTNWTLHEAASTYGALVAKRRRLEDQITAVAAFINSHAPIHRLPDELLAEIFLEIRQDDVSYMWDTSSLDRASWFGLTAVCRSWRLIACGTPFLWQNFSVGRTIHIGLFKIFLRRSGNVSLMLRFNGTRRMAPLLSELRGHFHRIAHLDLNRMPVLQAKAVARFLREDMPSLKVLLVSFGVLGSDRPLSDNEDVDIDGGDEDHHRDLLLEGRPLIALIPRDTQFPSLKELMLRNVALTPPSSLAHSLTSLILENCNAHSWPLTAFASFVKECSCLEYLNLRRYHFYDPDIWHWRLDGTPSLSRVTLDFDSSLESVVLDDEAIYTARFLSAFSLSPHTTLVIDPCSSTGGKGVLDGLPDSCLPADKTGLPLITTIRHLEAAVHPDVLNLMGHGYGVAGSLIVCYKPSLNTPLNVSHQVLDVYGESPLMGLTVRTNGVYMNRSTWIDLLSHFARLKRLVVCVSSHKHTINALLDVLAYSGSNGPTHIPNMMDLTLAVAVEDTDAEVEMLNYITKWLAARTEAGKRFARLRVGFMGHPYQDCVRRRAELVQDLSHLATTIECFCDEDWSELHHRQWINYSTDLVEDEDEEDTRGDGGQ
ncbi:hypothetical protein C8Q73DRAFT_132635 [Cubamyces lactineus]|nr:hypothetical protein C8Q73DRAFT_132635 [Cubamyces lactineus]